MSDGYENIIVLEANRQQAFIDDLNNSEENNSLWTNHMGSGIKIDIGDTIELHSAYVSETGAQDSTIEIEGKEFNDGETSSFSHFNASSVGTKNNFADLDLGNSARTYRDYNAEKLTETTTTFNLNDYSVNILVSPYKTSNGEFCAMLPRRFIDEGWTAPNDECANSWDKIDSWVKGNVYFTELDAPNFNKHDARPMMKPSKTTADYGDKGYTEFNVKNRTDNSRYTIFTSDTIRNASGAIGTGLTLPTGAGTRDPATCRTWKQVKYPIKLSVSKGFNSPSNIAEQLTTQLNERTPYEKVDRPIGWSLELGTQTNITATTDTPSYKPYNCAKASAYSKNGYVDWDEDKTTQSAYNYYDSFQNIGVKRPDLYRLGRELNGSMGFEVGGSGTTTSIAPSHSDGSPPFVQNDLLSRENSRTDEIITNLQWTQENLDKLKNLFDAQAYYPELFDYEWWSGGGAGTSQHSASQNYQTIENSRFLHMNRFNIWVPEPDDGPSDPAPVLTDEIAGPPMNPAQFGSDNYNQLDGVVGWTSSTLATRFQSGTAPFFISYDPNSPYVNELDHTPDPIVDEDLSEAQKINFGAGNNITSLAYGFALKRYSTQDGRWHIAFTPELTLPEGSLCPSWFYQGSFNTPTDEDDSLYLNGYTMDNPPATAVFHPRLMGWDHHFNAYGCPCMLLTNGQTGQNATSYGNGTAPDSTRHMYGYSSGTQMGTKTARSYEMEKYMYSIYLGANKSLIDFDSSQSRFTISNLHTPEHIGNLWDAGKLTQESASDKNEVSVPENPSADSPCYKINKTLNRTNYNTDMSPYKRDNTGIKNIPGTPTGFTSELTAHNYNIDTQTIFDAMSGLFIEDFGMPEKYWDKSLWGLMGFTYDQFHPSLANKVNRQTRIANGETLNYMEFPTTCQKVVMDDSLEWTRNIFDKPTFNPIPFTFMIPYSTTASENTDWFTNVCPEVVVSGSSVEIVAKNLPTKTLRPYFTIRTDLIKRNNFIGSEDGGQPLPVVGIVDKMNGQGDFFFQQSSELVFTNTEQRTINSITTSIHDPDGRLARVDKNSSILYRINKHVNADLTPVQTLMNNKDKISKDTIKQLNQELSL